MKKSNLVTLLSLCFIVVAVILFMFLWKTPSASSGTKTESNSTTQSNIITTPKDTPEDTSSTETEGSSETAESGPSHPSATSRSPKVFHAPVEETAAYQLQQEERLSRKRQASPNIDSLQP